MKATISLPDPVFEAAEELAERLGMSRSQLYTQAVEAFVRARRDHGVTERLDRIYGSEPSDLDPVWADIQWASIPREEW